MPERPRKALPDGPLVAWYGDDFTGAAAVMEVMTFAGYPSVLFLDVPDRARLERFAAMRGIGIAGTARARSPDWMTRHLPPVFDFLAGLGAPLLHYKVCSTLDSSPEIGSIGRAVELALRSVDSAWVPLLLAAPAIRRYQAFGHLFAAAGSAVHRLDRHPVMARHPSTPMDEADVVRHLARQTSLPFASIDLEALSDADTARRHLETQLGTQAGRTHLFALDTVDERSLGAVGRLIWEHRGEQLLAVGSQGVEYALVRHWRTLGTSPAPPHGEAVACERLIVLSGSVSASTAVQIDEAIARGARAIAVSPELPFLDGQHRERALAAPLDEALRAIARGHDPVLFTARGPDDPAVRQFHRHREARALAPIEANRRLGAVLGDLLVRLLERSGLRRVAVCGGDSSGHVLQALDIHALTALAPLVPGAALLRAHSDEPALDGLQLSLKGGQMGPPDFFAHVKNGGRPADHGD